MTLIVSSVSPAVLSLTMFLVFKIIALIGVSVLLIRWFLPDSLAFFHTLHKCARIGATVCPSVLSMAVCFSKFVFSKIYISIPKRIRTLPMPQTELPFTLIYITIGPFLLTKTMWFILFPLAYIIFTKIAFPDTISLLNSIQKVTIISVPICPCEEAFASYVTLWIVAQVLVPIAKSLIAFTMAFVLCPIAFVDPTYLIHTDALAMA